jgi:uncharacterized membrane protein YqjE
VEPTSDREAGRPAGSAREAGAAIVGLVGTRLELMGVELREEAIFLQRSLVLAIVAAFLLGGALVLAGALVAVAFWDSHRLLALGGVCALYAIIAAACVLRLRSSVVGRAMPFETTARELQADLRALRETAPGAGA